jgi:alpha-beta hydrolase superfamily lysophospholipase
MALKSEAVSFEGQRNRLSGVLHLPSGEIKAGVVLAHCFTCSKSYKVVRHLASGLADGGYAVLRFDFTGLGESEGDFAETSVTTNVDDLESAAGFLTKRGLGPCALVGHSLGGAAVLLATHRLPNICAVAVVAAPATTDHVRRAFSNEDVDRALATGRVRMEIAGRPFDISAEFFQDLERHDTLEHVTALGRPILVVHPTADRIVGIEEGEKIFTAARQPRWFVAIPDANHLFTQPKHADIAARVIVDFLDAVVP